MRAVVTSLVPSEEEFAALVDELAADPKRRHELTDLLREDHTFYDQRGAATIVQMRGWVLLALGRAEVSVAALGYVLEELDTGVDPYLVAAAAFALRSYSNPNPALACFVMRALGQIRYHNDPVSFDEYGGYAVSSTTTSPVRELLLTLAWLGPCARGVLPEIEALRAQHGLPKKLLIDVDKALSEIRGNGKTEDADSADCCTLPDSLLNKFSWFRGSRRGTESIESTVFEDQDGAQITFRELFHGRPSIAVFFYTRCDNPLKCSLTVTKLARIQKLLKKQGLAEEINTAAITYDPGFDLPERIRRYGLDRSVSFDVRHRMLRARGDGFNALRRHFKLGVNFIESLVNRHRIELYILDADGRIAASFERLHWDEQEVVNRAIEVLRETDGETATASAPARDRRAVKRTAGPVLGTLASLGVAFFPKCPVCWAAYLSLLGIAGLNQIPYSPWLQPVLAVVVLINLVSVGYRAKLTGRMSAAYLVSAGAVAIVLSKVLPGWGNVAGWGVALTFAGSLLSAVNSLNLRQGAGSRFRKMMREQFSPTTRTDRA